MRQSSDTHELAEDEAAFGVVIQGAISAPEFFDVLPENQETLGVFLDMEWNEGFRGITGMRLETLPTIFRGRGIGRARQAAIYADLIMMRDAVLDECAKLRRQSSAQETS